MINRLHDSRISHFAIALAGTSLALTVAVPAQGQQCLESKLGSGAIPLPGIQNFQASVTIEWTGSPLNCGDALPCTSTCTPTTAPTRRTRARATIGSARSAARSSRNGAAAHRPNTRAAFPPRNAARVASGNSSASNPSRALAGAIIGQLVPNITLPAPCARRYPMSCAG